MFQYKANRSERSIILQEGQKYFKSCIFSERRQHTLYFYVKWKILLKIYRLVPQNKNGYIKATTHRKPTDLSQ